MRQSRWWKDESEPDGLDFSERMKMKRELRILFCHCAYANILPSQMKQDVLRALEESGLSYDAVPDLCELAARKAPLLSELAGAPGLTIAACHPRAVQWLFAAGGAPLRDEGVEFLDMREASTEQLLHSIHDLASDAKAAGCSEGISSVHLPATGSDSVSLEEEKMKAPAWEPWFPVIDYARCQNCQQCLGFCLFGVYGVGPDGKVQVKNAASCKTGCPACARVCPEAAIIFPKYASAPINGGEVKEGDSSIEPVKVDKTALMGGDLLKVLHERGKNGSRFSPDPDQIRAVQERLAHLAGSRRPIDVPLSALTSKPPAREEPE
jgi:Pyruvate/2-oxoacid:ferredoxin oxidoreductase delta subunit